jgi:hypothetical protein
MTEATPLHIDLKYKGPGPFQFCLVPENWAHLVGFIAVLWGQFESQFDDFIESMVKHNGTTITESWKRENFRKRKKLFRDEARTTFKDHPNLRRVISDILAEAARLQLLRSILLHGNILGYRVPGDYALIARLERHGRIFECQFRFDELEAVFADLSFLCGKIGELSCPDETQDHYGIPSHEKSYLRDFLRDNPPSPPISVLPIRPPRPSPPKPEFYPCGFRYDP